jgi:hypothetical protein
MRRHSILLAALAGLLSVSPALADCLTIGPAVAEWSGAGHRDTEPFTVASARPLRMSYTIAPRAGIRQLCWSVHGTDGSYTTAGGCSQQEFGDSFLYLKPGEYYLSLSPTGEYNVKLEATE